MKLCIAIILFTMTFSAFAQAKSRTWTSDIGTEIDAELVRYEYGQVTLESTDGRILKIPLARFSSIDQNYIKNINLKSIRQDNVFPLNTKYQIGETNPIHPVTMVIVGIAILVGAICIIILIVKAFCKSIWWGLGFLFVPFVPIIFVAVHWRETKRAFLGYLASAFTILGVLVMDASIV